MKKSAKTAFGGMITALSIVLMLLGNIPLTQFACPAIAGVMLMIAMIEIGKSWAFSIYVAVSLLSLLLGNKEAAVFYIAIFGYYPILKFALEPLKSRILQWLIKLVVFNTATVAAYIVLIFVFGMPLSEMGIAGTASMIFLLVLVNLMFIMYDICISKVRILYLRVWQKRIHKIFKF